MSSAFTFDSNSSAIEVFPVMCHSIMSLPLKTSTLFLLTLTLGWWEISFSCYMQKLDQLQTDFISFTTCPSTSHTVHYLPSSCQMRVNVHEVSPSTCLVNSIFLIQGWVSSNCWLFSYISFLFSGMISTNNQASMSPIFKIALCLSFFLAKFLERVAYTGIYSFLSIISCTHLSHRLSHPSTRCRSQIPLISMPSPQLHLSWPTAPCGTLRPSSWTGSCSCFLDWSPSLPFLSIYF